MGASIEEKIVWCHTRNGVIDKIDFVLCRQGHHHHSTPSVVSQSVRDENDPRMVPIMKINGLLESSVSDDSKYLTTTCAFH